MRIATLLVIIFALLTAAPLSAQSTGELRGCITDAANQQLPRVAVVLRAVGAQQTLLADAGGCYEVKSLPANAYRVTVHLLGFDNETREKVRIEAGATVRLDFQMRPSAICECLSPPTTLLERWERVDAVAHLRITDHNTQLPAQRGFFGHTADVLEVFKRHLAGGPDGLAMTVLQRQSSGEPDPYEAGEEFVVFLQWSPEAHAFLIPAHVSWVFVIQDGRTDGGAMRVEDLLAELRALSARR
jgi:Carboxypeptidase regulatory-like domain